MTVKDKLVKYQALMKRAGSYLTETLKQSTKEWAEYKFCMKCGHKCSCTVEGTIFVMEEVKEDFAATKLGDESWCVVFFLALFRTF